MIRRTSLRPADVPRPDEAPESPVAPSVAAPQRPGMMSSRRMFAVAAVVTLLVAIGFGAACMPPTSGVIPPETPTPEAPPTLGPTPRLAIDPQPALQSGEVSISGSGFAGNEVVTISVASTQDAPASMLQLGTAQTNSGGTFDPVVFTLPDVLQSGAHTILAVGQISALSSSGTLWIRAPQPWLVMDNYDVPQYGDLGLVAGGFDPMDQVQVRLEPSAASSSSPPIDLGIFNTDQAGNGAWTQVKLPKAAPGTYSIVLHGQASAAELRRDMRVTPLKPVVELSPWAGPPGLPVQLNVRGFAPNERVEVSVSGAQGADPTVAQADDYGNLWGAGPVHIPQTAEAGSLTLSLRGDDSGATASADFKVLAPKPWLELSSWFGAPGAPTGFGGGGWIAGEMVTIHMGSATSSPIQRITTDDGGWLKGTQQIYIPLDVTENVIFVAVGEQSHLVCAATFTVIFPFGLHPEPTPSSSR